MDQCTGQGHALLLPARQRRRPLVGALGQADCVQGLQRLCSPVAGQAQADVVDHLFPWQQPRFLEHQPGVFTGLAQRRRARQQLAASGLVEPREQTQQGAFTATATPDDGDELSGRNMQVDVTQYLALAKGFLQVLRRQRYAAQ
ncbi:hypothetical protein D9M73_215020 [compost metagenome]